LGFFGFFGFVGLPPPWLPLPVEPAVTEPDATSSVTVLVRPGFVSAASTIVAVPAPNPVGTFTVAVVFGAEPFTVEVCEPLVNVTL
jgi:hypothetical protein